MSKPQFALSLKFKNKVKVENDKEHVGNHVFEPMNKWMKLNCLQWRTMDGETQVS